MPTLDIYHDKVWIHWDGTEDGFISYLEEHDVPPPPK